MSNNIADYFNNNIDLHWKVAKLIKLIRSCISVDICGHLSKSTQTRRFIQHPQMQTSTLLSDHYKLEKLKICYMLTHTMVYSKRPYTHTNTWKFVLHKLGDNIRMNVYCSKICLYQMSVSLAEHTKECKWAWVCITVYMCWWLSSEVCV